MLFVIADISGYTKFLAMTELVHAQDIIADFMGTMVDSPRGRRWLRAEGELELGDLTFRLSIRPRQSDRGADRSFILGDAAGERSHQAQAGLRDPCRELSINFVADHGLECGEMPTIGDLGGVGKRLCGSFAVSATAVTSDDGNLRCCSNQAAAVAGSRSGSNVTGRRRSRSQTIVP
jgi:hypothetical protein